MAPIVKSIENTASETIMTATSPIAPMAPMPGARHISGAIFSRLDDDARLESRAPSNEAPRNDASPAQIAEIALIAKSIENIASEATVTATSPIAPIAPISPDWRHLAESFCRLSATEEQLAELIS